MIFSILLWAVICAARASLVPSGDIIVHIRHVKEAVSKVKDQVLGVNRNLTKKILIDCVINVK